MSRMPTRHMLLQEGLLMQMECPPPISSTGGHCEVCADLLSLTVISC